MFVYFFRKNLDVTGYKTDEELWTALEIALVKDFVSDLPDGLDTILVDEGELQFYVSPKNLKSKFLIK